MRRTDETPIDPEIAAALNAIDATLAGEPVDPAYAELAELALLLSDERPDPEPGFSNTLDARVESRFASPARTGRRRPRWVWAPAAGLAASVVIAVVILASGDGGSRPVTQALSAHGLPTPAARTPAPAAGELAVPRPQSGGQASGGAELFAAAPNGRKVIQAAQLALSTAPEHVDTVAQEVFDVVGQQRGVVNSSTVTAGGPNGYAQFQLSIPSGSLSQAMGALSSLRYGHVSSRTDTTQDVNDQYQAEVRRLADARALRTSLLKQLAGATSQTQIDSLTARIHDAEASISSDEATLRRLNRQVDFSQVSLTISAGSSPAPAGHGSGGFTLGKAAHDAGRVLTVAAGVALIALAALVPLALLGALGLWIVVAVRRRRREQALDGV